MLRTNCYTFIFMYLLIEEKKPCGKIEKREEKKEMLIKSFNRNEMGKVLVIKKNNMIKLLAYKSVL